MRSKKTQVEIGWCLFVAGRRHRSFGFPWVVWKANNRNPTIGGSPNPTVGGWNERLGCQCKLYLLFGESESSFFQRVVVECRMCGRKIAALANRRCWKRVAPKSWFSKQGVGCNGRS